VSGDEAKPGDLPVSTLVSEGKAHGVKTVGFLFRGVFYLGFLLALQFLTRIPVTVRGAVTEASLARSMAYFPLVGLLLGAAAATVYTLASLVLPAAVSNLVVIAFLVLVTGNMHGDGLMDAADGLFSGRQRDGMLEIMKDSRVGSHGVMAGALAVLFRLVLLGQLPAGPEKAAALIIAPVLGRWAQVYGAAMFPYARTGGGTGIFTGRVGRRELAWASLTALAATILLSGIAGDLADFVFSEGVLAGTVKGMVLAAAALSGTAALSRYISGRLNGMTGDTYGAVSECVEVLALTVSVIMLKY
jgi:adenosylcobinamide-GDP ribazoletransferase